MNKKMIYVLAVIVSVIGTLVFVIMFLSAILFYELGRAVIYTATTILSLELGIYAILKLRENHTRGD